MAASQCSSAVIVRIARSVASSVSRLGPNGCGRQVEGWSGRSLAVARQMVHCLLELGIVGRQRQRHPVLCEGIVDGAASLMNLRQTANCRQVFRRDAQNPLELRLRLIEVIELKQRAAERDPRRDVARMDGQAGLADVDRFLKSARAAALFCKLRKSDRRRVPLDPASKLLDSRLVSHAAVRNDALVSTAGS